MLPDDERTFPACGHTPESCDCDPTPEQEAAAEREEGEWDGDPDAILTCWCGARGTYEELFDDACLDEGCGGMGVLYCYCGGDFCVCHFHGETECPGCDDCEGGEDGDCHDYDPD